MSDCGRPRRPTTCWCWASTARASRCDWPTCARRPARRQRLTARTERERGWPVARSRTRSAGRKLLPCTRWRGGRARSRTSCTGCGTRRPRPAALVQPRDACGPASSIPHKAWSMTRSMKRSGAIRTW